ncbi:MAG TPA: PIN domain-containing protein [Terracidiphilus sp.]|nr:PIN domain-containing protein [Terracidiphilus sp.]
MIPAYMLDTDIASYIMKRSNTSVLMKVATIPTDYICISVIVQAELMLGVELSPRRLKDEATLASFLGYTQTLDFPAGAALHYAQIRAFLQRKGTMIGANDLFIAAHARYLGRTLVTNNTREFRRVPGLKIENWA